MSDPYVAKVVPITDDHTVPFTDVATVFPPWPTATNNDPFHATLFPAVVKVVLPMPVHVVPLFVEYAIVFVVPSPTATQVFAP